MKDNVLWHHFHIVHLQHKEQLNQFAWYHIFDNGSVEDQLGKIPSSIFFVFLFLGRYHCDIMVGFYDEVHILTGWSIAVVVIYPYGIVLVKIPSSFLLFFLLNLLEIIDVNPPWTLK